MSARAGDWSLLGHDSDPLPGDDYEVHLQSRHYTSVAETINSQISKLRAIGHGDAKGEYAEGLASSANDISSELSKVQNRFETVAEQLAVWGPALAEGRRVTGSLLAQAEQEHRAMMANQSSGPLPSTATDAERLADRHRADRYSSAQDQLAHLTRQLEDELAYTRSIAKRVAERIDAAAHDKVKDSWWDQHVRKWVHDHAHLIEIIVRVIELTAILAALVALVIATGGAGLVPLVGLAPETFAAVATAVDLAASLVLPGALLAAHGLEMDAGVNGVGWGTIALDALSLVTFGAGRYLGAAAKGGESLAGGALRSAATTAAEDGLAVNVKNALRIVSDSNPLKLWAQGQRATNIAEAVENVDRAIEVPGNLGMRILAGDAELAQTMASLRAMENFPAVSSIATRALHLSQLNVAVNVIDHLHLARDTFVWFAGPSEGGESHGG
ncbi:hypothetical protein [Oryzihumus leptocrescens]|uniref:Uncharacterized protein n=1 Tax=Oryzihumus leptocrescens TaxID=297536 RepID=A0A542ZNK4_9MICO|nr:hypothetical protein [Oryzihumus leptocrescens]TQL61922.1 hypothetical protein FB474_3346 [Oryzihumus leptocrescens]